MTFLSLYSGTASPVGFGCETLVKHAVIRHHHHLHHHSNPSVLQWSVLEYVLDLKACVINTLPIRCLLITLTLSLFVYPSLSVFLLQCCLGPWDAGREAGREAVREATPVS